jgi:hypothetical protein
MAAHHGERHRCGVGKNGGTRCESAAEGVIEEFEPPEEVAMPEDEHPGDLTFGARAGPALAGGSND